MSGQTIKPGCAVEARRGGPRMQVHRIVGNMAACSWVDETGHRHVDRFRLEALVLCGASSSNLPVGTPPDEPPAD